MVSGRVRHAAGLAALAVVALGLRPQMVGIGPLLPRMQHDLSETFGVLALSVAVPIVLMGLLAPPSAIMGRRLGSVPAVAIGMGLVAAFGTARILVVDFGHFLLLTVGVGFGTALAGTLLPVVVKEWFPTRPAMGTGAYATALQLGAAAASAVAVPAADAFNSWRAPLLFFSFAGSLSVVGWVLGAWVAGRRPAAATSQLARATSRESRRSIGSATTWLIVAVFTFMSVAYYGLNAWLPAFLVERMHSEAEAGALLALMNAVTVPATISVALIADRLWSRRHYLVGASASLLTATLLVVIAPGQAVVWVVIAGASLGGIFPIALALPVDAGRTSRQVASLAALVFGVGYLVSAATPVMMGAIRDTTGSFAWALVVLVVMEILLLAASSLVSPRRLGAASRPG